MSFERREGFPAMSRAVFVFPRSRDSFSFRAWSFLFANIQPGSAEWITVALRECRRARGRSCRDGWHPGSPVDIGIGCNILGAFPASSNLCDAWAQIADRVTADEAESRAILERHLDARI